MLVGAAAGVAASIAMAMYAMGAAWWMDAGFFTPLYHIASLLIPGDPMMSSMQDAMSGSAFHVELGPAVLGAAIHMMTGAMYGAVFGLIVFRLRLGIAATTGVSLGYGFLVFVVSSYIALPIAAAVFDSGDPIRNMAQMAGWGTFIIEHLLYGVVLGFLVALARPSGPACPPTPRMPTRLPPALRSAESDDPSRDRPTRRLLQRSRQG